MSAAIFGRLRTKAPRPLAMRLFASKPQGMKASPPIPDATTVFKMSNPELLLDPNKRASWKIVGAVVAFFSVYLTVSAYREGLLTTDGGQQPSSAAAIAEEPHPLQHLPNGRVLMPDGSIVIQQQTKREGEART